MNRAAISLPSFLIIHAFGSPFEEKTLWRQSGRQKPHCFGPYRDKITSGRTGFIISTLSWSKWIVLELVFLLLVHLLVKKYSTAVGHQYFGPYSHEITRAAMASPFRLGLVEMIGEKILLTRIGQAKTSLFRPAQRWINSLQLQYV